jgi:hypothetical protein
MEEATEGCCRQPRQLARLLERLVDIIVPAAASVLPAQLGALLCLLVVAGL